MSNIQRYVLFKVKELPIACEALIKFMNYSDLALVLQIESNSKPR